jgi:hypothetical protein
LHESLLEAAQLRSGVGEFRSNTIDLLRYGLDVTVEASQTVVDESEVCGLDYPTSPTLVLTSLKLPIPGGAVRLTAATRYIRCNAVLTTSTSSLLSKSTF